MHTLQQTINYRYIIRIYLDNIVLVNLLLKSNFSIGDLRYDNTPFHAIYTHY